MSNMNGINNNSNNNDTTNKGPVKVYDDDGHYMMLQHIDTDGVKYGSVNFCVDGIRNIPDFPLRDDDILLCSYPKSGSHWLWEIIRMLISGHLIDDTLEKDAYMMELSPPSVLQDLPSPRILNNHASFDHQPKDMMSKKVKTIFLYRNLKDVATSYYHHIRATKGYQYQGDFGNFLRRMKDGLINCGNPFPYLRNWQERIDEHPELSIFECSYEDLQQDPLPILRKLCQYLGYDHSDEFLQQVIEATSFETMRTRKGGENCPFKTPDGKPVMYRKGTVGDWKNHFTVSLNEWFDQVLDTELKGSRFTSRYEL